MQKIPDIFQEPLLSAIKFIHHDLYEITLPNGEDIDLVEIEDWCFENKIYAVVMKRSGIVVLYEGFITVDKIREMRNNGTLTDKSKRSLNNVTPKKLTNRGNVAYTTSEEDGMAIMLRWI